MIYLLDDFTDANVGARRWRVFSDRVMGGVSNARADFKVVAGRPALCLSGRVSLERNGGFIQVARSLEGERVDASQFRGLQLAVTGTPGTYFVHLRTADTRAPWQYYAAALPVTSTWQNVSIPWRAFAPASLRIPLDPKTLERIGIVAGTTAFDAAVAISRLELVP
jgi:hypothetical protein